MKRKLIRSAITIVSILLAISLVCLAATVIEYYLSKAESTYVVVPDNYIKEATSESSLSLGLGGRLLLLAETPVLLNDNGSTYASLLRFEGNTDELNKPFEAGNMFPGDKETKYYLACVTFRDYAVLKFQASVRDGYEKLSEVMKIKVEQISEDKVLYDGLMRDMPVLADTELFGNGKTTADIYYKITAYLDTSVGNEYMNKELVADFYWWIDEYEQDTEETTEKITSEEPTESETTEDLTESSGTESDTETDTTEVPSELDSESEETSSSEEVTTEDDHEHAPQTSDSTMVRVRLTVIIGIIALLMLILMLLLMSGDRDNEEKQ